MSSNQIERVAVIMATRRDGTQDRQRDTVLVVEDEYPIRRLLQEGLAAEGFSVRAASGASQALEALEDELPAVVLLDLMLPDESGIDLACQMHSRGVASIIAMSASNDLLAKARKLPEVLHTIAKPFDWETLVYTVRRSFRSGSLCQAS